MKKVLFVGALGTTFIVAGFYIGFLYFQQITNGNIAFLFASIVLVMIGLLIVYYAEQLNASEQKRISSMNPQATTENVENIGKILERNNQLVSLWHKTSDMQDKLKMIKAAANTQKKSEGY